MLDTVTRAYFILLALGVLISCGHAQTLAEAPFTTLPTGEVALSRLVDLASEVRGVSVEYDAQLLRGTVVLRVPRPLAAEELWTHVSAVLNARGLALIERPNGLLSVVRAPEAAGMAPIGVESQIPGSFRSALVGAQHVAAERLAAVVSPLLSGAGTAEVIPGSSLLLITGRADRVETALEQLAALDVPARAIARRVVTLEHQSPADVVALASQAMSKQVAVGGKPLQGEFVPLPANGAVLIIAARDSLDDLEGLLSDLDREPLVQERVYQSRRYPAKEVGDLIRQVTQDSTRGQLSVVVDPLTDSLIVRGGEADHARVKSLIDRLDEQRPESSTIIRSISLRNRPVDEVLAVIEPLLSAAPETLETAAAVGVPAEVGTTPADPSPTVRRIQASGGVQLSADPLNNALLAVGTPRAIDQIERLIRQADVRQPQVMIEVLLVSLTDGQTRDLGVELSRIISAGGTLIRLQSLFGLSDITPEATSTAGIDGEGGTGVILNPGDFSAVVRALETVNEGRSLSIPRVLVNNNQDATLDSVAEEPFLSTNASDTVATTSFGGSLSAGTQVTVRPQIAAGDHLVLQYSVSLSAFTGEAASASLPPPRQENSIASVATIPDGYCVAIGGIDLFSYGDATSKTPLLGDIPIVGLLFKNRSESETRSRFYAFIRASVLRHQTFEDLKYISETAAAEAGVDDGWPKVEPRIIR